MCPFADAPSDPTIHRGATPADSLQLRVLVVDAGEVARGGLQQLLEQLPIVQSVRSVDSLESAQQALNRSAADLVILTSDSDEEDVQSLASIAPAIPLLLVLKTVDRKVLDKAARLSVQGFVVERDLTTRTLARALQDIAAGGKPIPPILSDYLLRLARSGRDPPRYGLTPPELDALGLMVEGLTDKEIGIRLGISRYGAKRHVANVLAKLHCHTRAQAAARAVRENLVETD